MRKILYLLLIVLVAAVCVLNYSPEKRSGAASTGTASSAVVKPAENAVVPAQGPATVWVIVPESCRTCKTGPIVDQLRVMFPGLNVVYLGSQEAKAAELIEASKITMLPAYFISREVESAPYFLQFARMATLVGDKYYINPLFTGVSYFLGRPREPKKVDLFIFLTDPSSYKVLEMMRELTSRDSQIRFTMNFLGEYDSQNQRLLSPKGDEELTEDKLYGCIESNFPKKAWDYLSCRLGDPNRLWLEDCLKGSNIPKDQIKKCFESEESGGLLDSKVKLSSELNIFSAPLILLDNVEVFGVSAQTTADEVMSVVDPGSAPQPAEAPAVTK